jgi:importin-9
MRQSLVKIRTIFPSILTPHSLALFQTAWEELSNLRVAYHALFITDERQGRLEDADGLPYTLDFLIADEIDLMENFFKAPPVKTELQRQLHQASGGPQSVGWLREILRLMISYTQITTEEEGLWSLYTDLFLSEETSLTANYTPRVACGALVVGGLLEWLKEVPVEALLLNCKEIFADAAST